MTVSLFEYERRVTLCRGALQGGCERWEQLFKLRSGEAAIDGKAPFPM